jgi:catechol 2,3-dioxygenase-like lactoylglutathione lyase family enzyme
MAKLRHVAVSVANLEEAARFYEETFELKRLSENDIAINLSDGVVNLTLLHFPTDEMAGDARGKDYVGVHHIGFITDDAEALGKRIREKGGQFKGASPSPKGRNAEDKYTDPEGIVFDVSQHGWLGTS